MTPYEEIGEARLRRIIDVFVERVCEDVMIGFLFASVDRQRLKRFEFQHAARVLGADVPYEGRPLQKAHAAHTIMGGQFSRRKQILREVLDEHGVSPSTRDLLLEHTEKLRALITGGKECVT